MIKPKYWLLLLPAMLLIGCTKSSTKPPTGSLVTEFRLTDAAGNTTETFYLGEDIYFEFTITNQTGEEQHWTSKYDWPAARFNVKLGEWTIGSSYEGRLPQPSNIHGVLQTDERNMAVVRWLDHPWHSPLAVGSYIAQAVLNYEFAGLEMDKQWEIRFKVVPPGEGTTQIFALDRLPIFDFTGMPHRLDYVSVIKRDDDYVLSGTFVYYWNGMTAPCMPPAYTDQCVYRAYFDDIYLSNAQGEQLRTLLLNLPAEVHLSEKVCDPAKITMYYIGERVEEINPCATGSDEYWRAVRDIENLLAEFAW